jgi:acyl-CoA reductase-like NAD-dependent aldehyde dehydrogenase
MATKKGHQLDAEDRNEMSDSTFAFPRVRKEPLNDARHVRNAIARFDQVQDVSDRERDEAFRRIKKAAARFGVEVTESSWRELGKPTKSMKSSSKPRDAASKADLYAEAKRRNIEGRSSMTKAQLQHALRNR